MGDEIQIRVVDSLKSKQIQHRNENVRLLVRSLYLVLSVVPAGIVVWQWDNVLPLLQQRPPVVQPAPVLPPPQPAPNVHQRVIRPRPATVERRELAQPEIIRTPLPTEQVIIERPPQHEIALNLGSAQQRTAFDVDDPETWRVTSIEGQTCTVEPTTGELSGLVVLSIDNPRKITFRVKLTKAGDRPLLQIVPQILADNGRTIPFTIDRIERYHKGVISDGNKAVAAIEKVTAEKNRLQLWVDSAGNKPLFEWKNAIARINAIPAEVVALQERAAVLQADLEVTNALLELAQRLNGSKLRLEKAIK